MDNQLAKVPSNKKIIIKKSIKALAVILEISAAILVLYLIVAPIYPAIKYNLNRKLQPTDEQIFLSASSTIEVINKFTNKLPESTWTNRIIIPKIGINAPITRSIDANYGLSRGAWMSPDQGYPGENRNVVISGHRFKYLPPNNLTFYLLDKLITGDIITIYWNAKPFIYKVTGSKVVPPTDLSILASNGQPILTLYTCTPIFSEKNRLVVIAELVK